MVEERDRNVVEERDRNVVEERDRDESEHIEVRMIFSCDNSSRNGSVR